MGKKISYILVLLVEMISVLHSSTSYAAGGGGMDLVVFDCQPNISLYVKGFILYDITPVLNKQTISLDTLADDQKVQECQLTPTDKVVVTIGRSQTSNNGDALITLNGQYLGHFAFDHPHDSYTYIFGLSLMKHLRVDYIRTSDETKEKKNLTPGAGDVKPNAD